MYVIICLRVFVCMCLNVLSIVCECARVYVSVYILYACMYLHVRYLRTIVCIRIDWYGSTCTQFY